MKLEANRALRGGGVGLSGVEPIVENLIVSVRAKMTMGNRQWVEHDKQSFLYFLENTKTLAVARVENNTQKQGFDMELMSVEFEPIWRCLCTMTSHLGPVIRAIQMF